MDSIWVSLVLEPHQLAHSNNFTGNTHAANFPYAPDNQENPSLSEEFAFAALRASIQILNYDPPI